jgi:hypothetical protein
MLTHDTVTTCLDQAELRRFHDEVRAGLALTGTDYARVELTPFPYGATTRGWTVVSATIYRASSDQGLNVDRRDLADRDIATWPDLDHATVRSHADRINDAGTPTVNVYATDITFGPWITTNLTSITEILRGLPYGGFGGGDVDACDAQTISDAVAALNLAAHSPVGASADLDVLHGGNETVDVRVMVRLSEYSKHQLVDGHTDLTLFLPMEQEIADDDPDPALTRLVYAVTSVIRNANWMLTDFFTDFTPRD